MISWTKLLNPSCLVQVPRTSSIPCLKVAVWNITSRCNLSCRHCYFSAQQKEEAKELNRRESEDFISDLAGLNVHALLFSGGEPLLKKDIFLLAGLAKDKGIKAALSTNGTLISKEIAEKIRQAGFSYVGISLDGGQGSHDAFRRSRGAFKSALSGIRNCQEAGLKVGLRFTLTRYNLKDLNFIFSLIEKEAIPRLCIYHLVYSGKGKDLIQQDLSFPEKRGVLEIILQRTLEFRQRSLHTEILTVDNHADGAWIFLKLKEKDPQQAQIAWQFLKVQGGNGSGMSMAAVDNLGNVYPDQFFRTHSLGNIRRKRFNDIWQDEENEFLRNLRNRRPLLKGRCRSCSFIEICNGNFRARAEAVSGDPWAEDPACYLTNEEINGRWN